MEKLVCKSLYFICSICFVNKFKSAFCTNCRSSQGDTVRFSVNNLRKKKLETNHKQRNIISLKYIYPDIQLTT